MNAPVTESTLTVPPPAEVTVALKVRDHPSGSVNDADPVTTPVALSGLPGVATPATGAAASTAFTRRNPLLDDPVLRLASYCV